MYNLRGTFFSDLDRFRWNRNACNLLLSAISSCMHSINNEYNTHLCTKVKGKLILDPVLEKFCSNSFMRTESNIVYWLFYFGVTHNVSLWLFLLVSVVMVTGYFSQYLHTVLSVDDRFPPDATVEFSFSSGPEKNKGGHCLFSVSLYTSGDKMFYNLCIKNISLRSRRTQERHFHQGGL